MASDIPRDEAEAALQARRDLGPEYEPAVVESFVERLDSTIEERVNQVVERRLQDSSAAAKQDENRSGQALALGIVSMALSIPLIAIASDQAGAAGMFVIIAAIVLINVAFNLGGRRRR